MARSRPHPSASADDILPEDVPVPMPDLPHSLQVSTPEQFRAYGDPTRVRILGIIQNQPATAKQIADRLGLAPGTAGHHLQVLEAAGLAQVVARRLVRGIVAKYYTRTARIFNFDALPPEMKGPLAVNFDILTHARDELAEVMREAGAADEKVSYTCGFPHMRLSPERARAFAERLGTLMDEFVAEPYDPEGEVCGMAVALFKSPAYLQAAPVAPATDGSPTPPSATPGDAPGR